MAGRCNAVMAGLVPAIHVLLMATYKDVDARHKAGHDVDWLVVASTITPAAS
jgi:hypothetical protein